MIQKRVKAVIEHTGLNDSAFAKKIGVQQMTLWRQLNDQRKLSLETITAIVEAFPEIDANWLIKGTGTMIADTTKQEQRLQRLVDVIAMQQETINNLTEKINQLKNQ